MKNLLLVHYGPGPTSITKKIVADLNPFLTENFNLEELDLVKTHPIIFTEESMHAYVKRNYHGQELTDEESKHLTIPDNFANQVLKTDLLVMIFPMYNFQVPAVIKGWIDNVAQAKKVFKYTEYGPIGLSNIQKGFVVQVTGSTPSNSAKDFLTPYMDFILKFIGVKEVKFEGIHGTKFLGEMADLKVQETTANLKKSLLLIKD